MAEKIDMKKGRIFSRRAHPNARPDEHCHGIKMSVCHFEKIIFENISVKQENISRKIKNCID
jgi:hypothetical protein